MKRQIENLYMAREIESRPPGLPMTSAKGAKAFGVRYEKALKRALPRLCRGQWYEFADSRGHGWCQTDFELGFVQAHFVFESKYTWRAEAHEELNGLYLPVVRKVRGNISVFGLVVCKKLTVGMGKEIKVFGDLGEALTVAALGRPVVWHWLGEALPQTHGKQVLFNGALSKTRDRLSL